MLPRFALAALVPLTFGALASCGTSSGNPPLTMPDGCQPLLGGYDCFLPYPSDYFRVPDATTKTGFRLAPTGAGKLVSKSGTSADFGEWRPIDGASRIPVVLGVLPSAVADTGLPKLLDPPENSLSAASATAIVDPDDGSFVPHYADLDARALDATRTAIVLHPLVALKPSHRYVVALHGVKQPDGTPATPAEGLRRLRDREGGDAALDPLRARYDADVFAPLEKAGIARKDLQLAWDFTTTSGDAATADMFRVRDLTMQWLATSTPVVTVTSVDQSPAANIAREVHGTITGPLFMQTADPGAELARDASGQVVQNGTATFEFIAQIPASVQTAQTPGRAVGFGHGIFGNYHEAEGSAGRAIADRLHAVTFAIDWWGMSSADVDTVLSSILNQPSKALLFSDRVHQAMANWMVTTAAIKTSMTMLPDLQRTPGGALAYDPASVSFFGASQGAFLGTILAALDPDFSRVILNVGGAGWTHVMFRARPFIAFLGIIGLAFPDRLDQQKVVASMQPPFDRIDPAMYAPYVVQKPLPGSQPDRRVCMQNGLGDVSVPNLGSWLLARQLGIPEITPNPYAVWGVPQTAAPVDGSALTVWDYGIDLHAVYDQPIPQTDDNPVHNALRVDPNALTQMDGFLSTGKIEDPCGGPCRATP